MDHSHLALSSKLLALLAALALGMLPAAQAASVEELERRIQEMERTQQEMRQMLQELKREKAEMEKAAMAKDKGRTVKLTEDTKFSIYGSIRPALTYSDSEVDDPHNFSYQVVTPSDPRRSVEVTDFFTRLGAKGETDIGHGLTAFAKVEMEIAIDQNGGFDPRLALAGLKGGFGSVALGRQWHPHYNTIVEVTDVYNHRSSPFGYDRQGPFRRPNLVTYSKGFDLATGSLKLDTGLQFSKGGRNQATDKRGIDSGSIGLGYKHDRFYLGASYLERKRSLGTSRNYYGLGASFNATDDLYLAATVQQIEQDRTGSGDDNGHSIDLIGTYGFGDGYKIILGWFDVDSAGRGSVSGFNSAGNMVNLGAVCPTADLWEDATAAAAGEASDRTATAGADGNDNCGYTGGFNVTLQRQMSDNFRVFVEWLHFDYDNNGPGQEDAANLISTGIRYDFSLDVL